MKAGQQITPTLRLARRIGQGAMGSVWVADHLGLGAQVAVKFMSPALASDQEVIQRFRREASAAANIKSPHVAQVFDHGMTEDGTLYIVMELLEGEDLKERIRRSGALDPREVTLIVRQVAKALGRAHSAGIIHRDIKPDNIFLTDQDGELFVKVLDFGIAKLSAEESLGMTATGTMVGTPLYMSPEQLLSAKYVDFRADLWSLAVVTYRAMTGSPPFNGETVGALSVAVNNGVFTPATHLRPELPPALDAWFYRALRRDPGERFASAKEMADELERAVLGPGFSPRTTAPSFTNEQVMMPQHGAAAGRSSAPGLTSYPGWQPAGGVPMPAGSSPGLMAGLPSVPSGAGMSDSAGGSLAAQGHTLSGSAGPRAGRVAAVAVAIIGTLAGIGGGIFFLFSRPVASTTPSAQTPAAAAPLATSAAPLATPPPSAAEPPPSAVEPAPSVSASAEPAASAPGVESAKPGYARTPTRSAPAASAKGNAKSIPTKDTIGF